MNVNSCSRMIDGFEETVGRIDAAQLIGQYCLLCSLQLYLMGTLPQKSDLIKLTKTGNLNGLGSRNIGQFVFLRLMIPKDFHCS